MGTKTQTKDLKFIEINDMFVCSVINNPSRERWGGNDIEGRGRIARVLEKVRNE